MPNTFYVDPDGNFVNSGATALLPVKTLQRAIDAASDGDTIYIQNTSETNPLRLLASSAKSLTYRAVQNAIELNQTKFYATSSQDLSHGAIQENVATRAVFTDSLNIFASASTPVGAYDNTVSLYGAGSVKLSKVTTGDSWIRQSMTYYGRKVRHRIVYKNSVNGIVRVRMEGLVGSARSYDFTNEVWGASGLYFNLPSSTEWAEWISPWVDTATTDSGQFYISQNVNNSEAWIQEYHQETMIQWSAVGDGTWACPFLKGQGTWDNGDASTGDVISGRGKPAPNTTAVINMFKGATWQEATVVETIVAAPVIPGYAWYSPLDTYVKQMVYLPIAGEDVTALHFEKIFGPACLQFTAGTSYVHNPVLLYNAFADKVSGTAAVTYYNPVEHCSMSGGFNTNGSTAVGTYHSPVSEQPRISTFDKEWGGGFVAGVGGGTNTATMILNGAKCIYSGDDSYQPADQAKMYINGATSYYPRGCDIEVSFEVANTGVLAVRNFSGYGSFANSFKDLTSGAGGCAVSLTNCGFYGAAGNSDMTFSSVPTALNVYTMSNVYCGDTSLSGGAAYPVGFVAALNILASPPVVDAVNGDFTPTAGGAWQGTGTKWWAGLPNPIGADGEPFQDIKPDVGGIQSKHGAFHPVNL